MSKSTLCSDNFSPLFTRQFLKIGSRVANLICIRWWMGRPGSGLCTPNKWVTKIVEKFTRIYTRTLLFLVNLSLYKQYILVNDSMWLENRTRMLSAFRATPESSFLEIGFAGLLKNTCTYVWKTEKHSCTSEILQTCREPSSTNYPPTPPDNSRYP